MTKIYQFNLEDFNPDGMHPDEIEQWIAFIGNGQRPRVAKQWFPGIKGQFRIVKDMRNYLWNKLTAMHCRAEGKIETALTYEKICDDIYANLPSNVRW